MFVRVRRTLRKHRVALLVILLFNLILFYPSLFFGRIISPIDILSRYDPFATLRPGIPQNGGLNDIATSYLGLLDLPRTDPGSFHWNRYVASGIPGFGSVAAGVVSPFALIPALLLPFPLICTGILLLKINVAFLSGYLWLREERLGKLPAAAGAITICGSGIYAVWWLWPSTNAVALYPALLFLIARLMKRKRVSFLFAALLALSFALSGFPATIAYGAWIGVLYAGFLMLRERSVPLVPLAKAVAGVAVAVLISAPFVMPFISFLRRTGYLARREHASSEMFYPVDHLAAFFDPYRLGNPTAHLWFGDSRLHASNNFVEATIFLGILPLLLVVPGMFFTRGRSRFFWLVSGAIVLAAMFGMPLISTFLGVLPGIEYSPLARLRFLLPLPVGYLAACGVAVLMQLISRLRRSSYSRPLALLIGAGMSAAIAVPLAFFAAGFYPYIKPEAARVPESPAVSFLLSQQPPFRIAPAFNWLFPNSSEYYRLEDIRSHFGSEEKYRRIMQRIDPGSFGNRGTVITFNSLDFDVRDPFTSFLNVRYLVEQPSIDILRWEVEKGAIPNGPLSGEIDLMPGGTLRRWLDVPDASGVEIAIASIQKITGDEAELLISLSRAGDQSLFELRLEGDELRMSKVNLPLPESLAAGERLQLTIHSRGVHARMLRTEPVDGQDPLFVRFTTSPLILVREFPEGRVFQNLRALPRYYPVWDTRVLGFDELLADERFDPHHEAVLSAPEPALKSLGAVPSRLRDARVRMVAYSANAAQIETISRVPFLLASSEKLTPELQVRLDGRVVSPVEINGMFTGVLVAEGTHVVRFERRIGRGLWGPSALGVILLGAGTVYEVRRRNIDRRGAAR